MKRLPAWMAGGAEVTDLAYDIVYEIIDGQHGTTPSALASWLDKDEADVLRAYAELHNVGVIVKS